MHNNNSLKKKYKRNPQSDAADPVIVILWSNFLVMTQKNVTKF